MTSRRSWHLLGVPIDCIGLAGGTELAPAAMRAAGLVGAASLIDHGDTSSRIRTPLRDPSSGLLAHQDVIAMTTEVRDLVARLCSASSDPLLVMAGCCTAVPAIMGGVRQSQRGAALVYIDGHLDMYDGVTSPTGEAADMPLAVLLAAGPDQWLSAAGADARLSGADVHLLGPRDLEEARTRGSLLPEHVDGLHYTDAAAMTDAGAVGRQTAALLRATHPAGYWVHLDVDVLDETAFGATDYLSSGGMDRESLQDLLTPLTHDSGCLGLSIACYNPEKDPGGEAADFLNALLVDVLG